MSFSRRIFFTISLFLTFWVVTLTFSAIQPLLPRATVLDIEADEPFISTPDRTFLPITDAVTAENMWTYECEFKVQRPTTMTSACADFGEQVHSIKWTVWEKGKALGTGVYSKNDCDPDCADGTIYETPVKVELRDLTRDGNKYFLNTFTFASKIGEDLPEGRAPNGSWDISEFYRMVPEMHEDNP